MAVPAVEAEIGDDIQDGKLALGQDDLILAYEIAPTTIGTSYVRHGSCSIARPHTALCGGLCARWARKHFELQSSWVTSLG